MTSQRKAEIRAVLCMTAGMTIAALGFFATSRTSSTGSVLAQFSADWTAFLHIPIIITVEGFGWGCLLGAAFALTLLLPWFQRRNTYWKQRLFSFAALPLVSFTVPVGWYLLVTHSNNWITPAVYCFIFILFAVLGANTYRD